jgi:TRAP-type mannitol/chloroaromatic compound transport system permease large subunit
LTEQVTFVLIPPLVLIFLVLGTIFLGVATPTEGGAMGALGRLIMAMVSRGKLNMKLMIQALDNTSRLSIFVLFILIGSTVFSFTFNAADGHIWVEHLFKDMPGGAIGFLIVVNLLIFMSWVASSISSKSPSSSFLFLPPSQKRSLQDSCLRELRQR